jgi:hypothetical protein
MYFSTIWRVSSSESGVFERMHFGFIMILLSIFANSMRQTLFQEVDGLFFLAAPTLKFAL